MRYRSLLLLLFLQSTVKAQIYDVGDTIPAQLFTQVLNWEQTSFSLQGLRGKYVLLDFWGTGCLGCIRSFPKVDQLQATFRDRLQIVLVNDESLDSTLRFFAKKKQIQRPAVPMLCGAGTFMTWFPHAGLPHHVWIDPSGHIIATGELPDSIKLQRWLDGETASLGRVNTAQALLDIDPDLPVLHYADSGLLAATDYWSFLMPALQEQPASNTIRSQHGSVLPNRIYKNRCTGANLLLEAWRERMYSSTKIEKVVFDVQDRSRYLNTLYAYDLLVPANKAKAIYHYMQEDMRRYFGVAVSVETRYVRSCVLVRTSSKDLLRSKGGIPFQSGKPEHGDSLFILRNKSFAYLRNLIQSRVSRIAKGLSFVDATEYEGNIDVQFAAALFDPVLSVDLPTMRMALQSYGLDLIVQEWPVNVLLVKDRK